MTFKEINHVKFINTLYGQSAEICIVEARGTHSFRWTLPLKIIRYSIGLQAFYYNVVLQAFSNETVPWLYFTKVCRPLQTIPTGAEAPANGSLPQGNSCAAAGTSTQWS
jgi:hypothetical protein